MPELARAVAVAGLIHQIRDVATMPSVAMEISRIVGDPGSSAAELEAVIAKDQALSTRIVRVANSAMFGCVGRIASLDRAIFVLGFQSVRNVAIAASLSTLFRSGPLTPTLFPEDLWRHALATGVAAGLLARRVDKSIASDVFLAGLVHDIGITAELQYDRRRLLAVIERCVEHPGGFLEAEMEEFGATHEDFGAALLQKWRFPTVLVHAAGHHHRPLDLEPEHRRIPSIIKVADWMVTQCALGLTLDLPASCALEPEVLKVIGVEAAEVESLLGELSMAVMEMESMLHAA